MRLKVVVKGQKHSDTVTAVGFTSSSDLFSCSDDHQVLQWAKASDHVTTVCGLGEDVFPTVMDWLPTGGGGAGAKKLQSDMFALGSADGKVRFVSKAGRVEKVVEAHRGAVIDLRWSFDGSALLTGGEDGCAKVWSRSGMLRSSLVQSSLPIYACTWNGNCDAVLYAAGRQLVIKPLQPSGKVEQWKAHEGLVLCVDWNSVNGFILSGGEDRKYKVWDAYGRPVYASGFHDHPITALRWAPDGNLFAVGSFGTLRVCDQAGWSHCLEKPACGSILRLAWTDDSTCVVAAGSNGAVVFAHLVERSVEWKNYEVLLLSEDTVRVRDIATNSKEQIDYRDHVVKMSMAHGYLVVATVTQCYLYKAGSWLNPVVFDLPKEGTISLIKQSEKYLLLVDTQEGIQIYNYEGRMVCSPRLANARVESLNANTLALSSDVLAVRDHRDEKVVHIYDIQSNKVVGKPFAHSVEVQQVALSSGLPRYLAVVDVNRNLYITPLLRSDWKLEKFGTMVLSMAWHESCCMLAAFCDGRFSVWISPGTVYVDKSILAATRLDSDAAEYGKAPLILSFAGGSCVVRRADGTVLTAAVQGHAPLLLGLLQDRRWEQAARLCRFVKSPAMWAAMASQAAAARELLAAEIAYAALGDVDKVQYLQQAKEIPSPEGRAAALALFCHQADEAEQTLLQAGLLYRAIDMNCSLNRWERALDLAVKNKTHVDTVLGRRKRYLDSLRRVETDQKFLTFGSNVEVNWDNINAKVQQEIANEKSRPGAKPFA